MACIYRNKYKYKHLCITHSPIHAKGMFPILGIENAGTQIHSSHKDTKDHIHVPILSQT